MKQFIVVLMILMMMISTVACGAAATTSPTSSPAPATTAPVLATTAPASDTSSPESTTEVSAQPTENNDDEYRQIGKDLMASESLGGVRIGMTDSELTKALGEPDIKTMPSVLAADGKNHADWTYEAKGLRINMVGEDTAGAVYKVYSINAVAPCDFATKKGIKIGDSEETVIEEYGDAIEDNASDTTQNTIIAGSVYGGILFGIEDGKVSIIYIGAVTN